jgi:acyl carrier protein
MDSRESIRQYITGLLELKGIKREVSDTESLMTAGVLDSLDVMQTVLFLEQNFGVDFSVRPFNPDDFESIESIHEMVE